MSPTRRRSLAETAKILNPGKIVDAYRIDENLRLGADYQPWEPETHFRFPQDEGRLAHAALRCVGVGKCRRADSCNPHIWSFTEITPDYRNSFLYTYLTI